MSTRARSNASRRNPALTDLLPSARCWSVSLSLASWRLSFRTSSPAPWNSTQAASRRRSSHSDRHRKSNPLQIQRHWRDRLERDRRVLRRVREWHRDSTLRVLLADQMDKDRAHLRPCGGRSRSQPLREIHGPGDNIIPKTCFFLSSPATLEPGRWQRKRPTSPAITVRRGKTTSGERIRHISRRRHTRCHQVASEGMNGGTNDGERNRACVADWHKVERT